MHAQAHLALHQIRAAELHAEADEYRLARSARAPGPCAPSSGGP